MVGRFPVPFPMRCIGAEPGTLTVELVDSGFILIGNENVVIAIATNHMLLDQISQSFKQPLFSYLHNCS